MHDLHADFWPKTKTGVQGEGSILFEYFLDESWHHFRVQSKRLLLLGKKNALVALIIDTLLRDDKAGQLSKYKCLPLLLAEIADAKPESLERISSKKQRLLLAQASEDIGRTASSLSDQLVSDLLAEMLAKYSAGTKSAHTIEWFEDLLLGNANEGSSERDMDPAMKALAIRAESITEQCSRAQQDGMPEDAAVELRIALEASSQTMLPELKRAVFPQVSIQAKRWLENSGFGGSTPTPQSTVIKSQNIDLKLVELWSRRFSPLGGRRQSRHRPRGRRQRHQADDKRREAGSKQRSRHRRRCPGPPPRRRGIRYWPLPFWRGLVQGTRELAEREGTSDTRRKQVHSGAARRNRRGKKVRGLHRAHQPRDRKRRPEETASRHRANRQGKLRSAHERMEWRWHR